jgi:hypothetical protein
MIHEEIDFRTIVLDVPGKDFEICRLKHPQYHAAKAEQQLRTAA